MRLVYKKYEDNRYKLYTTDDRGRNENVLASDVPAGDKKVRRVPLFIELSCDDEWVKEAKAALDLVIQNLPNAK
jgi:hypothetical protein